MSTTFQTRHRPQIGRHYDGDATHSSEEVVSHAFTRTDAPCVMCVNQRHNQATRFVRERRMSRSDMVICAHVWGNCTHRDRFDLIPRATSVYCDECGSFFCRDHHHLSPTAVREQRCADHGRYMARCIPLDYCDDCDAYRCESHEHDHESDWEDDQRDSYVSWRNVTLTFESGPTNELARGQRFIGFEIEAEGRSDAMELELPFAFGITEDGSLSDGVEVVTPPARGEALVTSTQMAMDALGTAGYRIEDSCGLHTHIDLRDKREDMVFLSRLFATFYAVEDVLYAMQSRSRHRSSYSIPLRNKYAFYDAYGMKASDFEFVYNKVDKTHDAEYDLRVARDSKWGQQRYMGFNFHSVFHRGTLEVRIHEGTLDAYRILLWADLIQSIVAKVDKGVRYKDLEQLLVMPVGPDKVERMSRYFALSANVTAEITSRMRRPAVSGIEHAPFFLGAYTLGTPKKGRAASLNPKRPKAQVATHWQCPDCGMVVAFVNPRHHGFCRYQNVMPNLDETRVTVLDAGQRPLGRVDRLIRDQPRTRLARQLRAAFGSPAPAAATVVLNTHQAVWATVSDPVEF